MAHKKIKKTTSGSVSARKHLNIRETKFPKLSKLESARPKKAVKPDSAERTKKEIEKKLKEARRFRIKKK